MKRGTTVGTILGCLVMLPSVCFADGLDGIEAGLRKAKDSLGSGVAHVKETILYTPVSKSFMSRDMTGENRIRNYDWAFSGDKLRRSSSEGPSGRQNDTVQVSDGVRERTLSRPASVSAPSLTSGYFDSEPEMANEFDLLLPGYKYEGKWIADLVANGTFSVVSRGADGTVNLEGRVRNRTVDFTVDPAKGFMVTESRKLADNGTMVEVGRVLDTKQFGTRFVPSHVTLDVSNVSDRGGALISRWELEATDVKPEAPESLFDMPKYPAGAIVHDRKSWTPYRVMPNGEFQELTESSQERARTMLMGWLFVTGLTMFFGVLAGSILKKRAA